MIYAIFGIAFVLLVYAPHFWVQYVMRLYSKELDSIPGTGGELAQHLIKRFELSDIRAEETESQGDHYDPREKVVRLSSNNFHGKSLTAVAIAAHEVGHAIQFHRQEATSKLRAKYLPIAMNLKRVGVALFLIMPIITGIIRAPHVAFYLIAAAIGTQLVAALVYLIILPEEWDASFYKALPILIEGGYIAKDQIKPVKQILKAAAFTYFAGALLDIIRIGRWIAVLRR